MAQIVPNNEPIEGLNDGKEAVIVIDKNNLESQSQGTAADGAKKPQEFKHGRSFLFALIASIFFGIADYLIALMSIKNGIKWVYPTWMITTFVWTIFHVGKWVQLNKERTAQGQERVNFWDKNTSVYFKPAEEKGKFMLNWGSIWVSMRRFVINFMIYVSLGLTFIFANRSGIHTGVITSIFCSSLIFTCVYFYFKFD